MSHETCCFPFLRPRPHSSFGLWLPHRIHRILRIFFLQNNGTAPHHTAPQSIQSLHASCTHPPPVQYVLLAWLLSHRQTLGCFAVLIIFFIHLDFFSFTYSSRTHTCLPAVVISNHLVCAIFKSFLVQFLSNCLYSRACTYFHFISSLFTFVFFSLFLKLPCESKNHSPESYVFVPSIRNRTRNRILSSVFTRRLPR